MKMTNAILILFSAALLLLLFSLFLTTSCAFNLYKSLSIKNVSKIEVKYFKVATDEKPTKIFSFDKKYEIMALIKQLKRLPANGNHNINWDLTNIPYMEITLESKNKNV